MEYADLADAVPLIRTPTGRRRRVPTNLHADKAHDRLRCRRFLRTRHITVRIARRGIESGQLLGRHRWVVESTLARLNWLGRLAISYKRRADIHQAFLTLGCALTCFNHLSSPEEL